MGARRILARNFGSGDTALPGRNKENLASSAPKPPGTARSPHEAALPDQRGPNSRCSTADDLGYLKAHQLSVDGQCRVGGNRHVKRGAKAPR